MVDQRLRIIISALSGEAKSQIAALNNELGETEAVTKKVNPLLTAARGSVIALGTAYLSQIPALVQQGEAINRSMLALEGYTGSAEAAEMATKAVQSAAKGAVSEFEATQQAAQLFAMGLATTADEAAKLTEMAVTLGAAMGKGPSQSFEEFTLLLANQSIPRLDTFGISGARVRERIAELQAETKGLSREQAFLTAVMEDGNEKLEQLAAAGFEATSSVDRLKALIADATSDFAEFHADGLLPIIDGLFMLRDATEDHNAQLAMTSVSYQDYTNTIIATRENVDILTEAEYNAIRGLERMHPELRFVTEAAAEQGSQLPILATRWEEYANAGVTANKRVAEAVGEVDLSLTELTEKQIGQSAFNMLEEAYNNTADTTARGELRDAMQDIGVEIFGLDPAFLSLQQHLDTANDKFQETGDIDEYRQAIARLRAEVELFQSVASDGITIGINDIPGGPPVGGGGGTPTGGGTTGGTGTTGLIE